jgi:hypothetical protein
MATRVGHLGGPRNARDVYWGKPHPMNHCVSSGDVEASEAPHTVVPSSVLSSTPSTMQSHVAVKSEQRNE